MVPERWPARPIFIVPPRRAFLDRKSWEFIHAHSEPHSVMGAVLNWFKSANKPWRSPRWRSIARR